MATIKKRAALGKIFKTKKETGTQTEESAPLLGASGTGTIGSGDIVGDNKKWHIEDNKKWQRIKTTKLMQWESHKEKINGYYFALEGEEKVRGGGGGLPLVGVKKTFFLF